MSWITPTAWTMAVVAPWISSMPRAVPRPLSAPRMASFTAWSVSWSVARVSTFRAPVLASRRCRASRTCRPDWLNATLNWAVAFTLAAISSALAASCALPEATWVEARSTLEMARFKWLTMTLKDASNSPSSSWFCTTIRVMRSPPASLVKAAERVERGLRMVRRTKNVRIRPMAKSMLNPMPSPARRMLRSSERKVVVGAETPKAATISPVGRPLKAPMPEASWQAMQESFNRAGVITYIWEIPSASLKRPVLAGRTESAVKAA